MNSTLTDYITDNRSALFSLLEELVLIQSHTRNKEGVDRMGRRLLKVMAEMGAECRFIEEKTLGNHLIARFPGSDDQEKQILIVGHMDTVFPRDSGFDWYKESADRCFGPGVADMKGGLVVGIFALKALIRAGCIGKRPITFIFNSDEEIGSPGSRDLIRAESGKSSMAYVLEAGGLSNEVVTGRKGNLSFRLTVDGQAGHAAFAGKDKASAILELAHKTIEVEGMNQPDRGISANVGTVSGGIGPNTVPDRADALLDFRFLTDAQGRDLERQLSLIAQRQRVPGTASTLERISGRPAMPRTRANLDLFRRIEDLSRSLNLPVGQELRQGVSDANIIAGQGIPVIDGLGPVGAKDHSRDEYIVKDSLWERSILFAHILAEI